MKKEKFPLFCLRFRRRMDSISRGYKLAQMARERAKRNLQFSGPEVKPDDDDVKIA